MKPANTRGNMATVGLWFAGYPSGAPLDGKQCDHVILSPPYIVNARDVEMIVESFGAAVDEVFSNLPKG